MKSCYIKVVELSITYVYHPALEFSLNRGVVNDASIGTKISSSLGADERTDFFPDGLYGIFYPTHQARF